MSGVVFRKRGGVSYLTTAAMLRRMMIGSVRRAYISSGTLQLYHQNQRLSTEQEHRFNIPTDRHQLSFSTTTTTTTSRATFDDTGSHNHPTTTGSTVQHKPKPFPSLLLGANGSITASGSFAEAQKLFLLPDIVSVNTITKLLQSTNTGIVAHYYMDVELQGVLQAVRQQLPNHIGIADSLKMGDMAVDMVSNDARTSSPTSPTITVPTTPTATACQNIICLGVDFMSESVAAILQRNQYPHIPVYRAAQAKIGCSLAESAETDTYRAWLQTEQQDTTRPLLHVVYINTSLETKAVSNSLVPTITCTSSNVLQTILTAAIQIPNVKILYGPDTYMGENLITFLTVIEQSWSDERIRNELHAQHTKESLRQLRDSIAVYPSGNCIVHHMFGASVVETVKQSYHDAYVTAHLEVPGEMFEIAMHKSLSDQGVCGSTSDILQFIARKVQDAAVNGQSDQQQQQQQQKQRLQFILGTEAGMVTSIVSSVQSILRETGNTNVTAEIIFPVAVDAVMGTDESNNNDTGMTVVPGVAGGEGCSTAGGCATCPYMKMNSLDSLIDLLQLIQRNMDDQSTNNNDRVSELILTKHLPPDRLRGKRIDGQLATDIGVEPIVYMREFNQLKQLPMNLVQRVMR